MFSGIAEEIAELSDWARERRFRENETRERLQRGCKPRNASESAIAFVRGYEQTGRGSSPHPVWQTTYAGDYGFGPTDGRVLYSYATPIAFTTDDGAVYESCLTYSSSTSRHLSHLRSALIDAGYVMDARDARLAPSGVYGGWLRRERTAFARWVKREDTRRSFRGTVDDEWAALTVWTSDNGKWSIMANGDTDGHYDIPAIVLGHGRWTAAHVFADGYTMATGSKPLPAYVHTMAISLVNVRDAAN